MDPSELRAYLAELQAAGSVKLAKLHRFRDGDLVVEVEFFPPARTVADLAPASPFVDREGKPINLDDGMPELGRDDDITDANFKPKGG